MARASVYCTVDVKPPRRRRRTWIWAAWREELPPEVT
jgi:hypothetical protein